MSLQSFHIFFIFVSILFSALVSGWAFKQTSAGNPMVGLGWVTGIAAVAMAGYLFYFLKKIRRRPL